MIAGGLEEGSRCWRRVRLRQRQERKDRLPQRSYTQRRIGQKPSDPAVVWSGTSARSRAFKRQF